MKIVGLKNVVLLVCKRTRFGEQKDSFWSVKGLVLECKRTPFEKRTENVSPALIVLQ